MFRNPRFTLSVLCSMLAAGLMMTGGAIHAMAATPAVPALAGAQFAQLAPPLGAPTRASAAPSLAGSAPTPARPPAAAAPASPPAPVPAAAPAAAPPAVPAAPVIAKRRPTPAPPTESDIAALERRLAIARSQLRTTAAVEAGTLRSDRTSYVRAKVVFPFYDKSIFEVNTSPDRMTSIELQPGEKITTSDQKPKAADTVNWIVETVQSGEGSNKVTNVLVKPTEAGTETNMLIPTNRRTYYVVLRSDSQAYMPIVGFNYPFDEAVAAEAATKAEEVEEAKRETVAVAPDRIRFGYSVRGSSVEWKPVRVFDDGAKTYIQMPQSMRSSEAPALFVIEENSEPQLVNYRLKGDYYIVDRLFSRAQLRVGTKSAVDIYRDDKAASERPSWFGDRG